MSPLHHLTIASAHQKIKNKEISVTELVQAFLDRIHKIDPELKSYLTVCDEQAIRQARRIDADLAKGKPILPLTGIPLAPKDIYLTKGIKTTCASRMLQNFVAPYNATVVQNCLDAGAVIVGKTNMDEFAMGSSTENSFFKTTRNPWDQTRTPGGSSGGSAAAVSASLCLASLGTDTGGSIRQPASFCSIVGLKPTYGRVSRYGTIAFASSLDQMGPMTRDVRDCATILNIIAGHDPKDSTSVSLSVPDYTKSLGQGIQGIKVGVPKEYFSDGVNSDVKICVEGAINQLERLGARLIDITLPHTKYAVATYYIIAPAEASANLARYDGVRFGLREKADTLDTLYRNTKTRGFGPEVKRRILLGTYVLSAGYYDAYYVKAQKARTIIRDDYLRAFEQVDVIAGPVCPTTAFKLGDKIRDPLQMYLLDVLTLPANLSGLPGMS
ncbi:MAG: hypothetical protein ACD_62C00003G0001, partial [uncultured bacterium]